MKKILVLLFLLLLLIYYCVNFHSETIYKKYNTATVEQAIEVNTPTLIEKNQITQSKEIDVKKEIVSKKPIQFSITQKNDLTTLNGVFSSKKQVEALSSLLIGNKNIISTFDGDIDSNMNIIDTLKELSQILPNIFKNNSIEVKDNQLKIDGNMKSKEDIGKLNNFIANLKGIKIINNVEFKDDESKNTMNENNPIATGNENKLTESEQQIQTSFKEIIENEKIEFQYKSANIDPQYKNTVRKIADILKKNSDINVMVSGHTDSKGDEQVNLKISQERAQSVKNMLIEFGVDSHRVVAKGFGKTKPLVSNTTTENMKKNRRVEITILKGK